jgi:calcineurin-like phosphoesterase
LRILVIGDIIGKPGRRAVKEILPGLCYEHKVDLVVGNGENAAGGLGLTPSTAEELFDSGIDVITSGNHIWAQKEIIPYFDSEPPLLRPLNYPPTNPGRGYLLKKKALIVNLIGRVFIGNFDCPFRAMDQLLAEFEHKSIPIIVDFHAEATFLTQIPSRLSVGKGRVSFDAILVEVDKKTGKAADIKRIQKIADWE